MLLPSTDVRILTAQDDIKWINIDYVTFSVENVISNNVNILLTKDTVNKNYECDQLTYSVMRKFP